jgi:hypothetical protein
MDHESVAIGAEQDPIGGYLDFVVSVLNERLLSLLHEARDFVQEKAIRGRFRVVHVGHVVSVQPDRRIPVEEDDGRGLHGELFAVVCVDLRVGQLPKERCSIAKGIDADIWLFFGAPGCLLQPEPLPARVNNFETVGERI